MTRDIRRTLICAAVAGYALAAGASTMFRDPSTRRCYECQVLECRESGGACPTPAASESPSSGSPEVFAPDFLTAADRALER